MLPILTYDEVLTATPDEVDALNRYIDHFNRTIIQDKAKGNPLCESQLQFLAEIKAFQATCPKTWHEKIRDFFRRK